VEAVSGQVTRSAAQANHVVHDRIGRLVHGGLQARILDVLVDMGEAKVVEIADAIDDYTELVRRALDRMRVGGLLLVVRTECGFRGGRAAKVWAMSEAARRIVGTPRARWETLLRRHAADKGGAQPLTARIYQDAILAALRERPGQRAMELKAPAGVRKAREVAARLMKMRKARLVRREVGADGRPRWYAAEAWS
jgi:predicted ArsR family transcriptional regulator